MDDVSATIRQLVFLEFLITLGVLVLLGSSASLIIRRELKPLEAMATAADEIAGGDLDRRVDDPGDPSTEIGRLGTAFNGMLDGIGALLDEQPRSEDRLRQFVADASHELRTPVAAVRGYTELYKAGMLPEEAAVDRAMDRMGFEAKRMGGLVEDLLTLIKADAEQHPRARAGRPGAAAGRRGRRRRGHRLHPHLAAGRWLPGDRRWWRVTGCGCTSCSPTCCPMSAPTPQPGRSRRCRAARTGRGRGHGHRRRTGRVGRRAATAVRPVLPGRRVPVSGRTAAPVSACPSSRRSCDRMAARSLASHAPNGGLTMTVVLPRPIGTAAVTGSGGWLRSGCRPAPSTRPLSWRV